MFLKEKHDIHVCIFEEDQSKFDFLFEKFSFLIRGIIRNEPNFIPKTKELEYTISLDSKSHYYFVVETLALNGFEVLSNEEKVKDIVKNVKKRYKDDLTQYASEQYTERRVDKKHDSLHKLSVDGNYKELIKIAKDVTYNPQTIETARKLVSKSVNNLIIKIIEQSASNKISLEEAADSLMNICSEKDLKVFDCDELTNQAGSISIDLCTKSERSLFYLIKISNKKNIDYILNVRAAIKFYEVIVVNEDKYEKVLKEAVKELNTRWLCSIIELVKLRLLDIEKMQFEKMIAYFERKR